MSDEIKLNENLPFLRLDAFLDEAVKIKEPFEDDNLPEDVMVLVVDRKHVRIVEGNGDWGLGLGNVRVIVDENAHVLALASTKTEDGVCSFEYNAHRRLSDFPSRLQRKTMVLFKALIGGFGIYPFKRIWAMTVPLGWRGEMDIELPEESK